MDPAFFFQSPLVGILPALAHFQDVIAQAVEGRFIVSRDASWDIQDIELIAERSASQAQFTSAQSGKMGMLARQLLERVQFFRLPPMLETEDMEIDEMESLEIEGFQVVS